MAYPVQCDCLLHTGFEPEWHYNAKGQQTHMSRGEIDEHHPVEIFLLFDGMSERGDARMDHEGIDKDWNRDDPPSRVKFNYDILKGYEPGEIMVNMCCEILVQSTFFTNVPTLGELDNTVDDNGTDCNVSQ